MIEPVARAEFTGTERFEVLSKLGRGGMGIVYEVLDHDRGTRVALKKLKTPTPEALLRFKSEFRALEAVQHPNLVMLGELIEEAGEWFFTMELVEGVDVIEYVTGDGGHCDEARLRSSLRQLASAVAALHAAGKVHRDIKPSNIIVQDDGRLALLDLGLVLDLDLDTMPGRDAIAGTAAYMAPEQAVGAGHLGPEADWYAVGVLIYQALSGQLPFEGSPLAIMGAKQLTPPPPVEMVADDPPPDLALLCRELLATNPDDRPTGLEVLRRLRVTADGSQPSSTTYSAPFVGRADELETLRDAFDCCQRGDAVTVIVEGESGVGKTSLVQRFVDIIRAESLPGVLPPLVLAGRCHEREAVPFKAIDDIVDALASYLAKQAAPAVDQLLPEDARLLARTFPVLRRVESIAGQRSGNASGDSGELRMRVFAALRELLGRIAGRRRLLLVIDDLQWADADSIVLLRELLRPPDPPALMLIGTVRTDTPGAIELPGDLRRVRVAPLPPEDAVRLAQALLKQGEASGDAAVDQAIADGAGGHPLFIGELVRYVLAHPGVGFEQVPLDEALWSRVRRLDAPLRRLLSLIAISGGPLRQEIAARAAEASDFDQLARWVSVLRRAHLVRTTGVRAADRVEPYHDRVRAAVLSQIAPEAQVVCHRRLAIALEGVRDGDPEALAYHWREAGDRLAAARHAGIAAERADAALAFDRAARLYRQALELGEPTGDQRAELLSRLGDALAAAGRGADAGGVYLEAAEIAHQSVALDLKRRAADQYLRTGHIADGMAVLDQVLRPIGMRLARSPKRALLSLGLTRTRVRLRGYRFRSRDEREIPREQLIRIDTCWAVSIGLALVDPIRASGFQARQLLLALKMGEPFRVVRGLSAEAGYRSVVGQSTWADVERLLERCHALAEELDDPRARCFHRLTAGIANYLCGRWQRAHDYCVEAGEFALVAGGLPWELFNARYYRLLALYWLGDLDAFARAVPQLIADADERGDLLAGTTLRNGLVAMLPLFRDEPETARRESTEVVSRLPDSFNLQYYWQMVALANAAIYQGDAEAALAALESGWQRSKRGMVLHIQYLRVEAYWTRARIHLLCAMTGTGDRARHLKLAARDGRRLAREKPTWIRPFAESVQAGVARQRGDDAGAVVHLERVAAGFEAVEMRALAVAAGRAGAAIAGGETAEADSWLRDSGVVRPDRLVATWFAGCG